MVDEDQDIQIVDMSMEEQPHSPEEAGANAKSPSPSPESPAPGPVGFCRDELYETHEEAEMMLDEAQVGEGGGESPPYVAPGARSPSPTTLAAEYKDGRGESDLSTATLESLERGRQSMEEIHMMAYRARMARDTERRSRKEREERSRSRSRSRQERPEKQPRGEEGGRRCKSATTWRPPSKDGASVVAASSASASAASASASASSASSASSACSLSEQVKEDPIRCKSPHVCRRAETGGCGSQMRDFSGRSRSVTPKGMRRSTASQE